MIFTQMLAALEENEQNIVLEIYDKYKKHIFAMALEILNNQSDAEDVLNDVMIKIMNNIEKFTDPCSKKTESLVVIFTRNTAIDYYRRNRKESDRGASMYLVDDNGDTEQIDVAADESTEDVVLSKENAEIMKKLLFSLPRESREVIELVCLHNFSYKEAAEVLGISVGVVAARYMRAKKKLLVKLEEAHYEAY